MPVSTALGFLTSGAALLALALDRPRVAAGLGGLLFLFAAAVLTEYAKGIDLGIDRLLADPTRFIRNEHPGRLNPAGAVCFAVASWGLLAQALAGARRERVAVAWLAGTLLVAGSIISLLRYLLEVEAWGPSDRAALHGGVGMLLLGIGLIGGAIRRSEESPRGIWGWLPIPVGTVVAAASILLWYGLLASAEEQGATETTRIGAQLQATLTERIAIRVRSLGRMALRLEHRPDMPRAEWQADADAAVRQEKVYRAINWIDSTLHVRWVAPVEGNEAAIGLDLTADGPRRAAVEAALASHSPALSQPLNLVQGGEGFIACLPLYADGRLHGLLVGVFGLPSLFGEIFSNDAFTGYRIVVQDDGKELYRYGQGVSNRESSYQRRVVPFAYGGLHLNITVEPSPALLALRRSHLPDIILALGIALAAVLMVTVSALQRARFRSTETAAANVVLKRRMEERTGQLHRSEESFRFLADLLPHLVWTARPDGRLDFINQGSADYAGLDVADLLDDKWTDVVHPDDLDETRRRWGQSLWTGLPYENEYRLRRADGTYRWHLGRAQAQHGAKKEIVRWVGTCTDIHDQKETRSLLEDLVARRTADLAASEEQFRHAFEHAGIGMALVGLDGSWLQVNRALLEIIGYEEKELLQKTFHDITHPDDLDANIDHVRRILDGEATSYQMSKRYFHRDGHVVWGRLTSSLVRDGQGRPRHFVSQIEDITARVRTEEALRESEERFRLLTTRAPIGILLADKEGRILYANPRWREMAGLNLLESPGPDWTHGLHPDDRDTVFAAWREMVEGGSEFAREFRFAAPGGRVHWVQARAAAVRSIGGQITGYVGTNADITELKDLEQQLLSQNAALELETSRAQEASRLKSEFLSNMSHELRTPLNGIIGFSELLHDQKAGPLDEQQVEFLGDVLASARHLLQLINDLLDLAKIEAGRMEVASRRFSLHDGVNEVCASLRPLFLEKQLAFRVSVETGDNFVVLDPGKFRQILYNLLSNAIKFTPAHGSIDLLLLPVEDDPSRFEVQVRDTGIGIKPDDFKRLFGEFQQLDSGTNRRYQGSGLGLALTRKLAALHGGTVGVESVFGEGSTFTVVLPRAVEPESHE
jgi:PAS domain S-box-containing protein